MAKPKAPLTIGQLRAADSARAVARLTDTTRGLTFLVGPRGGVWQWQGRVNGTPRKIHGGRFEGGLGVTLAQARAWADDINGRLAKGLEVYPEADADSPSKSAASSIETPAMTCQQAWDLYLETPEGGGRNAARTLTDKRQTWIRLFADQIGHKLLTDVTYRELAAIVEPLRTNGKIAAFNNAVRYIRRYFSWAEQAEVRTGLSDSPARKLKADSPSKRERYLSEREIRWLWEAVGEIDATSRAYILAVLLTGQRRDELRELVRSELDMARASMELSADRMKGGAPHITPFGDKAWQIICGRMASHNYSYVFPSPRSHLLEASYQVYDLSNSIEFLNALMKAKATAAQVGYERWTTHDLRRTFATIASGILSEDESAVLSTDHIERVLAHKIPGVRGIYNKHEYFKEKRRVLRVWENEIERIVGEYLFNKY